MRNFLFLALSVILFSCSPSKKNAAGNSHTYSKSVSKAGDNGLSYETAIVINETNESKGIAAEYDWIKNNYPGYKMKMQSLNTHAGKPYDVIRITRSNGEDLDLYFDISNFYGKF